MKTLNILNLAASEPKEENKQPRVLYPMPPKWEERKEEEPEVKPEGQEQPPEAAEQPPVEGEKVEGAPAEEVPDQPGMDLGLGEEPDEPDED